MGIGSSRQVEMLRDKVVKELRNYSRTSQEDSDTRFSRLLLILSPLRSIQPDVLEELFFAGLIGNVQIDSVVPYILKMESSEYQNQFGAGNCNYNLLSIKIIHFTIINEYESPNRSVDKNTITTTRYTFTGARTLIPWYRWAGRYIGRN